MQVKSLHLKNFRNHADLFLEFGAGFNVITGKNAAGKTNIVEAVFLCCIAKSPRADLDRELIRFGSDGALVRLTVARREGENVIEIELSRQGKKKISIDGVPVARAGELLGVLNAVFFSPDEIKVVKQSPVERRRFMDIDLSQSDKNYFYALSRYNKILQQRNNLLKLVKDPVSLYDSLPVWDKQMAVEGAHIINRRREFIKELSALAAKAHARLTSDAEKLSLCYLNPWLAGEAENPSALLKKDASKEEVCAALLDALEANFDRDVRFGNTLAGPHRDDIKIMVNGVDVRTYGSCGQQRTATLSLKLAETEHLYSSAGEHPVLILDDVFSELDDARQEKLLRERQTKSPKAPRRQTIVTAAKFDEKTMPADIEFKQFKI